MYCCRFCLATDCLSKNCISVETCLLSRCLALGGSHTTYLPFHLMNYRSTFPPTQLTTYSHRQLPKQLSEATDWRSKTAKNAFQNKFQPEYRSSFDVCLLEVALDKRGADEVSCRPHRQAICGATAASNHWIRTRDSEWRHQHCVCVCVCVCVSAGISVTLNSYRPMLVHFIYGRIDISGSSNRREFQPLLETGWCSDVWTEETPTAVTIMIMIFWHVTPCNSERVRRFGRTYHLHFQGRKVSQARNQQKQAASWICLLLGLHCDPENVIKLFLRNVRICPNCTSLQPRSSYCWRCLTALC
jgi:hypothetical protein